MNFRLLKFQHAIIKNIQGNQKKTDTGMYNFQEKERKENKGEMNLVYNRTKKLNTKQDKQEAQHNIKTDPKISVSTISIKGANLPLKIRYRLI